MTYNPKRKYKVDPLFFRCGHPRSAENSYASPSKPGYEQCRVCKLASGHRSDQYRRGKARRPTPPRPDLPRFELVSVKPVPDISGRSYGLAPSRFGDERRRVG